MKQLFQIQKRLPKRRQRFVKDGFKKPVFCQKAQKFSTEECWRQISCKKWLSDRAFYVTIADADIGSQKSLHTLFDKYLVHMLVQFEQNRMVRIIQNFDLFFFLQKMVNPFWQSVDAILEDVFCDRNNCFCDWNNYLMLKYNLKTIIFHCSKNYGSPTRVTRLKGALNMADPISLNEKRP